MRAPDFTHAACSGQPSEMFFPGGAGAGSRSSNREAKALAKAICSECPLHHACEMWARHIHANETPLDGIFAGKDRAERDAEMLALGQSRDPRARGRVKASLKRHLLVLALLEEGLSAAEIADRTGTSVPAAERAVSRARLLARVDGLDRVT